MNLWTLTLDDAALSGAERAYLEEFIGTPLPPVERIWQEMDRVWDEMKVRPDAPDSLATYYRHPVWLLNGVFTAADIVSQTHRDAIARTVADFGARRVADVGGGFGELARRLHAMPPDSAINSEIDIVEPFPHPAALARLGHAQGVRFVGELDGTYDCVIAQDVLEHVHDPVGKTADIARAIRPGGRAIIANCFRPVINCHLPTTFHLRHTFAWVVAPLGLRQVNAVSGAEHALVFVRTPGVPDQAGARRRERLSRHIGPFVNLLIENLVAVWHLFRQTKI